MFGCSRALVTSTRILGNTSGSPIVQTIKTEAQGPTAGGREGGLRTRADGVLTLCFLGVAVYALAVYVQF